MKYPILIISLVLSVSLLSCKDQKAQIDIPEPKKSAYAKDSLVLDKEELYDKILGALVGSAIGDAMGASTEMWHRSDIQNKYGYITGLTPAERIQSPEGTWEHNLNAGATTDDTRWKYFMVSYIEANSPDLNANNFAKFIIDYYKSIASKLGDKAILASPDALDSRLEKVDWIKEWARVAMAYQNSTEEYLEAQNRFYGGEMSCAGMLYTPMFGLLEPNPEIAYLTAYKHSLFDIGYAKDISGLVAAMTQMAMRTTNMDSILNTAVFIDPMRYQDSRLVGRLSYNTANATRKYVNLSREIEISDSILSKDAMAMKIPDRYNGTKEDWIQQEFVYALLEEDEKAVPFHAGEIWQILIAGLAFGEGDFEKSIQFIVNYGRDNDTVAAVAGMILGAKDGFNKLPPELRTEVLRVNKEQLGIDLEALASRMVESMLPATITTN
ncbi:ADP-ribosylglycohydrolase family protein [Eudoraea adriatica]|uniref:ADP-ribosylglycohydrolase family protein n=1 Tax=Eudoraea adriatica TaxID=446681 RepID=UPI000366F979|nr:ADP-ribosylglycohydrolase family protein [Eudoraea adriatica]